MSFPDPRMQDLKLVSAKSGRTNGVFTATLVWHLTVTISTDPFLMLPDNVGLLFQNYLPLEGTIYHSLLPLVTCRGVECEQVEGGVFKFTAKYSDENADIENQDPGTNENPLNDRPIIKPTAGMVTRSIHRDRDGHGILNAAKDPILQNMEDNTVGLRISANVAYLPLWVLSMRNTTNANAFGVAGLTIPVNGARFILPSDFLSERKVRNDVPFYVFTYELRLDERDYHHGRPLDAGFREIKDGKQVSIKMDDGSEPSQPVPLNADGSRMSEPTPETVRHLTVKKYPEVSYAGLPGLY